MVNFTILAGGYTSFIASYLFNTHDSSLTLLNESPTGNSPSWIALHPTNKSILYATNEDTVGMLQSFTIGDQGVLSLVDQISSGGNGPAFCTPLSTGQVAILNYNSGNGLIIPTTPDPLHFAQNATLITFPPPTGGVSNPHMALEDKNNSEVLVSDLGADKIWRLVEDGAPGTWAIQGFIQQPEGSGPRHMALYNETFYSLHELASTLTQQLLPPPPNGTTPFISNYSIIPPSPPAGSDFAAAEILLPTPNTRFPTPYIYVSNRNTGVQDARGDAITIFEVLPGPGLALVGYVYTGLDQIRGMMYGGERDEYIIAGGYASGGVAMFERVDGGANLTLVARNEVLPNRTSFVWL